MNRNRIDVLRNVAFVGRILLLFLGYMAACLFLAVLALIIQECVMI
jgi:hypothetical protein